MKNLKKISKINGYKKLRIFAASPSDVASERAKLETVVTSLKPMADYLGLTLEVIGWREVVPDSGRPQQIIFDQLNPTSWDIFVGILWHRFGTPPGGKDPQTQKDYLSGTEEEFRVAYSLRKQFGKPRIVMYRCTRPIPLEVDLVQAQRVKDFFKEIQDPQSEFRVLTQTFDTTETFEKLWLNNLQKLLTGYGKQSRKPITAEVAQTLAPKIPNNLPHRTPFFGRTKEMEVVMRALSPADRTWGVLVDGIGGIGKTALAIEAAHRAQEMGTFDAFVFVTAKQNILTPNGIRPQTFAACTLDDFLNETARVLGQSEIARKKGNKKRRALLDALRGMRALLIYDNLETLSKEEQEKVADFLRELPQGCKAIITSRRRGGEGAVWLRLEVLDWDTACDIIQNEMVRDEGLASKLRSVESRWQELYKVTHGSPLALVHTLGLMRVHAALTFNSALAMQRGKPVPDLQKFIFQEMRKELTTNDTTALGALSFFIPSATFEAWMQVANLSRNALEMAINHLDILSLSARVDGLESYKLQPVACNFVNDELLAENAQIKSEMGKRFAEYWVDYAKRFGGSSRNYKTFDQLNLELKNLYAAAEWLRTKASVQGDVASDKDAANRLNDLVRALRQFLLFYGIWDERVKLCEWAYAAIYALNDWTSAGWRAYDIAWIYLSRGQIDKAKFWANCCSHAWERGGNKNEQTISKRLNGLLAENYETAKILYLDALQIWSELKNEEWKALVLDSLGGLEHKREHYDEAEQSYREAWALAEILDNKYLQANIAGNIGRLLLDCKRLEETHKWYEKENQWAEEIGCQSLIAESQYGLARVYEAKGCADLALPLAQKALKIYELLQHAKLEDVRELVERLTTALNKKQN